MKSPACGEKVSNHEYHNGRDWSQLVSSTRFKAFYESPAAFKWPLPFSESPSMDLGTAVHSAVLEPEKLDDLLLLPDIGFRSNADKDLWRKLISDMSTKGVDGASSKDDLLSLARAAAGSIGKSIVTAGQLAAARAMSISVAESNDACDALFGGMCEMSFRSDAFKARPDCVAGALLSDLKTTTKFDRFAWQAHDLKYPSSLAWYERVLRECGVSVSYWAWIVVESNPYRMAEDGIARHRVKVVVASEELRTQALEELENALTTYKSCVASGEWPAKIIQAEELQPRNL